MEEEEKRSSTILKPVFYPSVVFIAILVIFTMIVPEIAGETFKNIKGFVADKFGWLYRGHNRKRKLLYGRSHLSSKSSKILNVKNPRFLHSI